MTRAPIVLRLAAVMALFAVVFLAQGSVLNGVRGLHPSPFASVEADATEEATVRISAKRLENGPTEFGLQVRSDGAWGPEERLLPRSRMFPANAQAGRWLRSSPLELDSGHVVRITAQLLENGRIEFGLHEVIDGELGERLLPRSRMFPTNPTVNRWLNSSPLVLPARVQGDEIVTEEVHGITEAGAQYRVDYPDFLNGERRTWVFLPLNSGHVDAAGDPIVVRVFCQPRGGAQEELFFQIPNIPVAPGEHTVRTRVDMGEWTENAWKVERLDWGTNVQPPLDYERLQSGTTVEIEIQAEPPFRATVDLAALFGTPVQSNIDNCGVPLSTGSYVPIVNVSGEATATIGYHAFIIDGEVHSQVYSPVPWDSAYQGRLWYQVSCHFGTRLEVDIGGFDVNDAELLNVTQVIDGVAVPSENWRVKALRTSDSDEPVASGVSSPNATELIGRLRDASSLTVTIDGSGLPPVTFDLTGMFDTPIQGNIDNCGNYAPGETREPWLDTSGRVDTGDGAELGWARIQVPDAAPLTILYYSVRDESDSFIEFHLRVSCSSTGTELQLSGSLVGRPIDVDVSWSVDGGATKRETWATFLSDFGAALSSPDNDATVLQAWRQGRSLTVTRHTETPVTRQIDLAAFFGTPVQQSLDECLAVSDG